MAMPMNSAQIHEEICAEVKPAAFAAFGAKFLARGGRSEAMEGRETPQRSVVIEFESYEKAVACYHSAAYQEAKSYREEWAKAEIIIVEGIAPL